MYIPDPSRFFGQDHRLSAADQLARAGLLDLDHVAADLTSVYLAYLGHIDSPLISKFGAFYFKSLLQA